MLIFRLGNFTPASRCREGLGNYGDTVTVIPEKLLPFGRSLNYAAGVTLILSGTIMLVRSV